MSQDRSSGAAAAAWGIAMARQIAREIGASIPTGVSNECLLSGKRTVIKCAAAATDSVGVSFKMLDRLEVVLAAFQHVDGSFEIWTITPAVFRDHMRDTRSKGASAGKVGLVRRKVFQSEGNSLGRVWLPVNPR
jgi:hypothetical protein